jgi:hypothetical protein
MSFFRKIYKFGEDNYLLGLSLLLAAKVLIEIPPFNKLIEMTKLAPLIEGWKWAIAYGVVGAVISGIHFNGKKIATLEERVELDLKKHGSFMPTILRLMRQDSKFSRISNKVLDEQTTISENLSNGVFSVQLELMAKMQTAIMKEFHRRMDAVSYADLKLWTNINYEGNTTHEEGSTNPDKSWRRGPDQFDHDLGRNYYNTTLDYAEHNGTILTRIFLLSWSDLKHEDNIRVLAAVFKQHMDDNIGVSLAFRENLPHLPSIWFHTTPLKHDEPRIDFALFDRDRAATFFRKDPRDKSGARCEAVLYNGSWAHLISAQQEIHTTLFIASILGTQQFFENIFGKTKRLKDARFIPFYSQSQRAEIMECIAHLRKVVRAQPQDLSTDWGKAFSVPVSIGDYNSAVDKLEFLKTKIEVSLAHSQRFRPSIPRYRDLLNEVRDNGN